MEPKDRLYVAIDSDGGMDDPTKEEHPLAKQLADEVGGFKVGSALFDILGLIAGGHGLRPVSPPIFLDLKWWDTPDTLATIGERLVEGYGYAALCTMHARAGIISMRAFREAVHRKDAKLVHVYGDRKLERPKLLAVTLLTSEPKSVRGVLELAEDALDAGMDGVTSPPYAIRAVRKRFGKKLLIVVPGIRFRSSRRDNHRETMTPFEAITAGADYIVMGRPITGAEDPVKAAKRAIKEIRRAEREFRQ